MNNYEFVILFLTVSWGGPIGLAVFLTGLGVFYWGKSLFEKAGQESNG